MINISERQYRDMDKTHIYSSMLKTIYSESARHLNKREENESFDFGSIAHMFILEKDRFKKEYIRLPELPKFSPISDKTKKDYGPGGKGKDYTRTNEWKEQRNNFVKQEGFEIDPETNEITHSSKKICTESDMETLLSMKESATKDFPSLFKKYLTGGKAEYNIILNHFRMKLANGKELVIPAKCRLDYVVEFEEHVVVVDVKTCKSANPKSFKYDIIKYGYDIQEAWYTDLAEDHFNKPVYFLFFAMEKQYPYNCAFYDTRNEGKSGYTYGREKIESVIEEAVEVLKGASRRGYVKQDTIVSI
jgi:hypothetical protein